MNCLISVIVPVYNAEQYLTECINSILNQTYTNLEIILVDDGSTDRSGEICDIYKEKDSRVRVYHKKNEGVSTARNLGLKHCSGKYITFVDSDDYVSRYYLEKLYQNLRKYQVGISICNSMMFDNEKKQKKTCKLKSGVIKCGSQLNYCRYKFLCTPWGKLFIKNLLDNICFDPDLFIGEDAFFVAQILKNSKTIYFDSQTLYMYRINGSSLTHIKDIGKYETFLEARKKIVDLHKEKSTAYLSAKLYYFEVYRQLVNQDNSRVSMFQKEFKKNKDVLWKVNESLKAKILLFLLAYCPTIYLKFYQFVKM